MAMVTEQRAGVVEELERERRVLAEQLAHLSYRLETRRYLAVQARLEHVGARLAEIAMRWRAGASG